MAVLQPGASADFVNPLFDTVPKFRMALDNHGNPSGWFPEDNGTLWIAETDSPMLSSPVVHEGRVYVGTMEGKVLCLSATSGSLLWEHLTGGPVESTPAVDGGRVYIGSDDRGLHCLDAMTGEPIWNSSTGGEVKSSPIVWRGNVIFGSNDYGVHCLNASRGDPVWNFSTGGWVYSSPAVWEGRAYVGSCDGRLYCLNASTGAELWRFEARYMPASPAVVGGVVVVGAYDDRLYALDARSGAELWNVSVGEGGIYSSAAVNRLGSAEVIDSFVGDNGGRLTRVFNGIATRNWTLGAGVKSSPAYMDMILDEQPRFNFRSAVIFGTEAGEVVAINPRHNATDAFYGPEYWWRLALGSSVASSPFMYNGRVYISATDGDGGLVACIGGLWPGEGVLSFVSPAPGSHVMSAFNVSFTATATGVTEAVVMVGRVTLPATWREDHWEARVVLGGMGGPLRVLATVYSSDGLVLAEGTVYVVARDPSGERPKVTILKPERGERVDPIAVASGRVEGEYPPIRLEASWDDSGCWTAFEPVVNWTLALSTAGLDQGFHTLRVRAFDGMFTDEASVKVEVGEVHEGTEVGLPSVIAIALLLAVVVALVLTRPKPPPKT